MKKYKALCLFSGGLDSILAVKIIENLGVEVIAVFFETPFFKADKAIVSAEKNNISLKIIDLSDEHMEMLLKPQYGYGKYLNPCIDCHGLMFKKAASLLQELNADFLISGEVLSQRPMSQRKDSLNSVSRLSGMKDLIVRPLSQKLLPPTLPVREGWINQEDLLDIEGRSRKRQVTLAKELGVNYYPSAGGGCLLTNKVFSVRLMDLLEHNQFNKRNIDLLYYGRHFRLNDQFKFVIGRDQNENLSIRNLAENENMIICKNIPGPWGLLTGNSQPDSKTIEFAASILLLYVNKLDVERAAVIYGINDDLVNEMDATKINRGNLKEFWIDELKAWSRPVSDKQRNIYSAKKDEE